MTKLAGWGSAAGDEHVLSAVVTERLATKATVERLELKTGDANLALNSAYHSPLFNAYVSLSGNVPHGLVSGNFGPSNNGPMLVMIGTKDEYANYNPGGGDGTTEQVYATSQSSRILVTIAGAIHLSAYIGAGPQSDDTRSAITNFLNVAEKQDTNSRDAFNAAVSSNGLAAQADLNAVWYINAPPPYSPGVGAGQTYQLHVAPNGTATVFGNLTVTNPTGAGYITAYPCTGGRPWTSNLNYSPAQTVANFAAVQPDPSGNVCFYTTAATDIIWDQVAETTGVTSHNAVRLVDTRH